MKATAAKNKGFQYERRIARKLGEWLYRDADALWRPSGSGSRATRSSGQLHPADIVPEKRRARDFLFAIECKNQEGWQFSDLLRPRKKKPLLTQWMSKLEEQVCQSGMDLLPWLIFTKNHHPDYIAHRDDVSRLLLREVHPTLVFRILSDAALRVYLLDEVIQVTGGGKAFRRHARHVYEKLPPIERLKRGGDSI